VVTRKRKDVNGRATGIKKGTQTHRRRMKKATTQRTVQRRERARVY
jgi:hypothetical protein